MNDDEFRAFVLEYMAASGDGRYPASAVTKIFNVYRCDIITASSRLGLPGPRPGRCGYSAPRSRRNRNQGGITVKVSENSLSEKQFKTVWTLRFLESCMGRAVRVADVAKWSNDSHQTTRARLSSAQNDKKRYRSTQRVQDARLKLIEDLGREPTQTEVAWLIGISRQRVSQIYKKIGLDPRAGQEALGYTRRKRSTEDACSRHEKKIRKDNERSIVLDLAKSNPRMLQSEIAILVGMSKSKVSEILRSEGIYKQFRYSPDEDELVLDTSRTLGEIGKLLNRSPGSVNMRRILLRSGMGKSKWVPTMEEVNQIMELYERFGEYSYVARELDLKPYQVKTVVDLNKANKSEGARRDYDE